jgi:hypothetical protein
MNSRGWSGGQPPVMMRKWIPAASAATHCRGVRHAEHLRPIVVSRRFLDKKPRTYVARRPSRPSLSLHLGNPQESQLPPGSTKQPTTSACNRPYTPAVARATVSNEATLVRIICASPLFLFLFLASCPFNVCPFPQGTARQRPFACPPCCDAGGTESPRR